MREVLILSGSIGAGHHSVARACTESIVAGGGSCEVLDCMSLLGGRGERLGMRVFRSLIELAPLYDAFHFSQLRAGSRLALRLDEVAQRRLVPALRAEIDQREVDALVAVFATGAGTAGRVHLERPDLSVVAVVTDAAAHRLWVHPGVDRYIVFSEMAAGSVRQYAPRANVVIAPPAVTEQFHRVPSQDEARARLGFCEPGRAHLESAKRPLLAWSRPAALGGRVVLVMGGAWGRGPLGEIGAALAKAGHRVILLAGSNPHAAALAELARSLPGPGELSVLEFTDRVPELMAAADVVVTSPGQTLHETRAVGRPAVVIDAVPGHGRENLLLELEKGGVLAAAPDATAIVDAVAAILEGYGTRKTPVNEELGRSLFARTLEQALS